MKKVVQTLSVPTTTIDGYTRDVSDLTDLQVGIAGITSATVNVMVSFDGTNFVQYSTDVTADGAYAIPDATIMVKLHTEAYSSGTIVAAVCGIKDKV